MNILRIVYEWPPPWGGLVPHPYELTVSQAKRGHKVYVMAGRWPRSGPVEEPEGVEILNFMGSSSTPFREPLAGTLLITTSILLLFRYIKWRRLNPDAVDVIHCHGHFAYWIYRYRKFLSVWRKNHSELKTPLVVHFHNTVEGRKRKLESSGQPIRPISKYIDWPLAINSDKLAVEIADALIFVGQENMKEAIEYYNADPNKCTVIESGVNADMFVPVGAEEKEKLNRDFGFDPGDKIVLYVGSMVQRKNVHLLVESMRYLPPHYNLLLVGSFDDRDYETKIDETIQKSGLTNRVVKMNYAPYPEVPIVYQGADIFVLPSEFEGTPKVVMESLETGVPVLASGFKLSEEIGGLFYLENKDPQYIAKRISEISNSSPFIDRYKVRDIYSWDKRAELIDQVYSSILEKRERKENWGI